MAVTQTEAELREWLDRLAIQDLIYRYSDAVTRADWHQCEAVFSPDATWESPILGLRHESRARQSWKCSARQPHTTSSSRRPIPR